MILVTRHGGVSMAVGAMRQGAYGFIEKPFSSDMLTEVPRRALHKRRLVRENLSLRRQLENREGIAGRIVGRSNAIGKARQVVLNLAPKTADVMILGETGTGKELVARCLHDFSSRREDIPLLFEYFVLQAAVRYGQSAALIGTERLHALMAQRWPGNVRELHNVADRLVLGLLDDMLMPSGTRREASLAEQVDAFEKAIIGEALHRQEGNVNAAAESLGIPKKTLHVKLKRFDISTDKFQPAPRAVRRG